MRRNEEEHRSQVAVVNWSLQARGEFPELALLFAIPNGGHRNVVVARKLKAEGVKRGVPDLMLPVARGGYHGLFIEMKAGKNRLTEDQEQWRIVLQQENYQWAVCYTSHDAMAVLQEYLRMRQRRPSHE